MMLNLHSYLGLSVALLLPWILGYVWVRLLWTWRRGRTPAGPYASLFHGYGYILGILATTLLMRVYHAIGLKQDFLALSLLLVALTLTGVLILLKIRPEKALSIPESGEGKSVWRAISDKDRRQSNTGKQAIVQKAKAGPDSRVWHQVAYFFFLMLIAVQFASYGLDIILRPLYSWDAWAAWAHKTRVWFELKELVPFVAPGEWLRSSDPLVFTAIAYPYPPTIPLIQVWTLLGFGQWDDALMNLPWLLCAMALGLAFYGQACLWGISPMSALVGVYFVLTLPFLGVHIALAGYADLWLAAVYCLAVMALLHWFRNADWHQGLLALLSAIAVTQIKSEGMIWALTLVAPVLMVSLPKRWLFGLITLFVCSVLLLFVTGGVYTELPGLGQITINTERVVIPNLLEIELQFYPSAIESFLQYSYLWGGWNLFWYLTPLVLLMALPRVFGDRALRAGFLLLTVGVGFIAAMFFFTEYFVWAENGTAMNRIMLHLVPAMGFVTLVLYNAIRRSDDQSVPRRAVLEDSRS